METLTCDKCGTRKVQMLEKGLCESCAAKAKKKEAASRVPAPTEPSKTTLR